MKTIALFSVFVCFSTGLSASAASPGSCSAEEGRPRIYTGTYASLQHYECPEWFRDAKFDIWFHWGPQCVPESSGWYARQMLFRES